MFEDDLDFSGDLFQNVGAALVPESHERDLVAACEKWEVFGVV